MHSFANHDGLVLLVHALARLSFYIVCINQTTSTMNNLDTENLETPVIDSESRVTLHRDRHIQQTAIMHEKRC
jgi:hypothetical protein